MDAPFKVADGPARRLGVGRYTIPPVANDAEPEGWYRDDRGRRVMNLHVDRIEAGFGPVRPISSVIA
jgi:hypothetical protein